MIGIAYLFIIFTIFAFGAFILIGAIIKGFVKPDRGLRRHRTLKRRTSKKVFYYLMMFVGILFIAFSLYLFFINLSG